MKKAARRKMGRRQTFSLTEWNLANMREQFGTFEGKVRLTIKPEHTDEDFLHIENYCTLGEAVCVGLYESGVVEGYKSVRIIEPVLKKEEALRITIEEDSKEIK